MKKILTSKISKYSAIGAAVLVLAAVGLFRMPHPVAQAQSSSFPNPGITVYSGPGAAAYSLSLPSKGPFTNDFQIALCLYNSDNSHSLCFTSPWASKSMRGVPSVDVWTVAGTGEPVYKNTGNWSVWGFPGIATGLVSESGGHALIWVNKGAALPAGEVIDNLELGLQLSDNNGGDMKDTTLFDYDAPSCYSGIDNPDPAHSLGAGYTGYLWNNHVVTSSVQIWEEGVLNCDHGFSPDVARMYMSDDVLNAASSSNNIPATFTISEQKMTGNDGQPMEITVKNTGNSPWVSDKATVVPGSEQGTCAGIVNGFDCPLPTAGLGATCTASIVNSSDMTQLKHVSGSFAVGSDPAQYSQISKNTCTVLPASSQNCSLYRTAAAPGSCQNNEATCTAQIGGSCSVSGSVCNQGASACQQVCGGKWLPACDGTWTSYATSVISGDPNIEPNATATFILDSLTAPSTTRNYTETWQMTDSGGTGNFGSLIPISIQVGSVAPTSTALVSPLTVLSLDSVYRKPVSASWYFDSYPTSTDPNFDPCGDTNTICGPELWEASSVSNNLPTGTYTLDPNPTLAPTSSYNDGYLYTRGHPDPSYPWSVMLTSFAPTNQATMVILWDPEAALSVNLGSVSITDSNPSGSFQVSNSGTPGSTSTWNASVGGYSGNGSGWLTVSPSTGADLAVGASPTTVTVAANTAGLANGTYTAQIRFNTANNFSFPGGNIIPSSQLPSPITVTLIVTKAGGTTGYLCTDPSGPTCTATTTPGYPATCPAACASTSTSTMPTVDCATNGSCPQCTVPALSADPTSIVIPEFSNLNYNCQHVTSCALSGGGDTFPIVYYSDPAFPRTPIPTEIASGTQAVVPTVTTVYTLACTNANDAPGSDSSVNSTVQVTVGGSGRCEQNPNGAGCPGQ